MDILRYIALFLIPIWIYIMIRNTQVYKEKMRFLNEVGILARKDITENNFNWAIRYKPLQEISYEGMLLKFWKPVNSFLK